MSTPDLINYGAIIIGVILTLISAFQLLKKGIIIWLIVIIVGVTAINYGLSFETPTSLDELLVDFDPVKVSKLSKDNLKALCTKVENY